MSVAAVHLQQPDITGRDADALASAQAAGLRYVKDGRGGFRRAATGTVLRVGKRAIPGFVFRDTDGHRLRDRGTLARIRGLAIPPAWKHVWICSDPNGHLQATGRDLRGRKQYRYHPRWRHERDGTKYARMIEFGRALPGLRRQVRAHLRMPGLPRAKVLATIVRLLETTFIRVGNEEYARSNGSFGLTTLKNRHVDVRSSDVRFHFRGKSGVYHQISVHDPSIARIVRRCRDLPGQELFQYLNEENQPVTIDSGDVNAYIRELTGHDFTAKDFRTWAGTVLAALALYKIGKISKVGRSRVARRVDTDRRRRPTNKDVLRAVVEVAEKLGNTPAVCRKCYIHPQIIAAHLEGDLAIALERGAHVRSSFGLRAEEAAVWKLLRRGSPKAARSSSEAFEIDARSSVFTLARQDPPGADGLGERMFPC